jgi:hypothetical protein
MREGLGIFQCWNTSYYGKRADMYCPLCEELYNKTSAIQKKKKDALDAQRGVQGYWQGCLLSKQSVSTMEKTLAVNNVTTWRFNTLYTILVDLMQQSTILNLT